jgi:hypothetical protein
MNFDEENLQQFLQREEKNYSNFEMPDDYSDTTHTHILSFVVGCFDL